MDDVALCVHEAQAAQQARREAEAWLFGFEVALRARDVLQLSALFRDECYWRDILALTWHLSSAQGTDAVSSALAAAQASTDARHFHLPQDRRAPRKVNRVGIDSIEAIFEFETAVGRGSGLLRLSATQDGEMRAWLVSTVLDEISGHEERVGARRPSGAAYSRNFGGDNWADMRSKALAYADREPTVLVVGGAQSGLAIDARLNQLGVGTLVVERWPRIGDSWRRRYHSLALHNSPHINHLPYMEFPPTWPTYIPKDMLGNWFECYADAMEINCWTDTEFVGGDWDEAAQCWATRVKCADGSERMLRPRHLVFANGVSSIPIVPDLPGLGDFAGEVVHAEEFDMGAAWAGKNALIVGTGSSANDIALDLHSNGVDTTLIQRGSITVVSIDPSARLNEAVFDEGGALADSDLIVSSPPPPLVLKSYRAVTKRMAKLDEALIVGLKSIGFKHDFGEDETGHQMKYFRRGGGYDLDAGSSALMIKGEIGLLQYDRIVGHGGCGSA
ncbi:MAG: NAD(P)-binding domain-containing protein [Janthinobacterium lividum]